MTRAGIAGLVLMICVGMSSGAACDAASQRAAQSIDFSREPVAVWGQQPDLPSGSAYTASLRLSDGYWAEAADDFELTYPASIDSIEWWGVSGDPADLVYVIVRFYLDDQTQRRGAPGAIAYQETIHVLVGEPVAGSTGDDWRYAAGLPVPFAATASNRYWVSIQGVEQSGQWYWYESPASGYWGEPAAFRSEHWGFPDWAPYSEFADNVRAFSFVLYADSAPVEALSWGAVKALFR